MWARVVFATFVSTLLAFDITTTNSGERIDDFIHSQTVGPRGPVLLQDAWVIERLQLHNRERIPERNVHARGTTAFGYFNLTNDFSRYTMADVFQTVGKVTPIACRWSTVIHALGSPEFLRDPRGFALKFYTQQGNYDIVGLNFPIFFLRDGVRFPEMIRSLKPSPITGVQEWHRIWDYFSNFPESIHMFTWLLDDVGIPRTYRHMDGWGIHTFKWIASNGESHFVRYFWDSHQGEESFESDAEAAKEHFSFHTIDLTNSIKNGQYPKWTLFVQLIPEANKTFIDSLGFDILDTTKEWPDTVIPKHEVGEIVFDKNVQSQFLENEMIAFSPARTVPGIEPSDERLLQARLFSYLDAQRYRLGTNYQMLPVNRPQCPFRDAHVDGTMNFHDAATDTLSSSEVNYFPSTIRKDVREAPLRAHDPEEYCYNKTRTSMPVTSMDDFSQPRSRYSGFDAARKTRFAIRVAETMVGDVLNEGVKNIWLDRWGQVDPELRKDIEQHIANITAALSPSNALESSNELVEQFNAFTRTSGMP